MVLAIAALRPAIVHAMPADPTNVNNPGPGELARLPEYCKYTTTFHRGEPSDPGKLDWLRRLGPTMAHLHHYCWALLIENRLVAGGISPQMRVTMLRRCIADIWYVLRNGEPDFVLLPELLYRLGTYHVRLGELSEAVGHFEQARDRRPDYWPAYAELAKIHLRLSRRQEAVQTLKEGLQHSPGQKELIEQLAEAESRSPDGRQRPRADAR